MVDRLRMSRTRNVRKKFITAETLANMVASGQLAPSPCQRNERWTLKDKTNYITALLRETTFAMTILVSRASNDVGTMFYCNDGQNRVSAVCAFLKNTVQVRAGDVLTLPEGFPMGKMMTFSDFCPQEQKRIQDIVFDLVELPKDDAEYLREVSNNMNRGKPSSAAERIHSWAGTHSMVCKVLNPLDRLLAARMHKMHPRWRCKNHGLVILFARVMAVTDWQCDRALWLTSSAMVESWVFKSPMVGYTEADFDGLKDLLLKAINLMDLNGFKFERPLFVDLCWAIDAFKLDNVSLQSLCVYLVHQRATAPPEDALLEKQFNNSGAALLRRMLIANYLRQTLHLPLQHNKRMLLTETEVNVVGFVPNEDDDVDEDEDDDDEEDDNDINNNLANQCPESGLSLFLK